MCINQNPSRRMRHRILWDFKTELDHLSPERRPDVNIIKNKKRRTCGNVDFVVPTDPRVKIKESKKGDKYRDVARELRKMWNMWVMVIPIVIWNSQQKFRKGVGNRRTNQNHPNYNIIEISQNTEKSTGDPNGLVIKQTTVKDHHLILVWKAYYF